MLHTAPNHQIRFGQIIQLSYFLISDSDHWGAEIRKGMASTVFKKWLKERMQALPLKCLFRFGSPEQLSSKSKSECNSWGVAWLAYGMICVFLSLSIQLGLLHWPKSLLSWAPCSLEVACRLALPCRAQTVSWELHSEGWRSQQTEWWKQSAKQSGHPEKETEKLERREPWALLWKNFIRARVFDLDSDSDCDLSF